LVVSNSTKSDVGSISWMDLTVANAEQLRDFYEKVVGWRSEPVDMGGYNDHCMIANSNGKTVAGVCHARGSNADLPPQWLIYIVVEAVERSAARCVELGGSVVAGPRSLMGGRFCVIRDPAGAVCALYQPAT
jgi:predicted enzyme related to lactoylglutathione lyase